MMQLICNQCKKTFKARNKTRKFCSKSCTYKGRKQRTKNTENIKRCQYCNKEFYSSPSMLRKFCSNTCAHKGQKRKERVKTRAKNCSECGKEFFPHYAQQECCSTKCGGIKGGRKRKKAKLYTYKCLYCKIEFQHRKKNKKFCSIECTYKNRKQNRLKNNAWTEEVRRCERCSTKFKPIYKPQKYCSRFCSAKAVGEKKTKEQTYETKCSWCSKKIVRGLASKSKHHDFCSQECSQASIRGNQEKFIIKKCPKCGKEFKCLYRKQTQYCSRSCSKSEENHPYYGKVGPRKGMKPWTYGLTVETDERIAKLGEKISEILREQFASGKRNIDGEKNPNHNKRRKNKKRTSEQLDRYSKAAAYRVQNYDIGGYQSCKRGKYESQKINKTVKYKSSYELRMLQLLDFDSNVKFYDYEPFSIKYTEKNRYVPDILVYYEDGTQTLIEIKGWVKDKEVFELKQEAAEKYCKERNIKYKVLFKKDIEEYEKQLGISYEKSN